MEKSSTSKHLRSSSIEVAIVLLAVLFINELGSIMGWTSSAASTLLAPFNLVMELSIIGLSLLGIYGLMTSSRIGASLTLLVSVFQIVLGISSALRTIVLPQLKFVSLFQAAIAIALGSIVLACIFKTGIRPKLVTQPTYAPSSSISPSSEYPLEIVNVTKTYELGPSQVTAVRDLSLKVRRGESVAIMGPSGSGKSTLLNLIGALDKPSSGHIYIDGVDISTLGALGLANLRNEKIGFVFQSYNLINRSKVLRNMELPAMVKGYTRDERLKRIHSLLKTVGLDDKADRRPKTLSGGEQQRVAIARALINEPKIILADEPTGNLDSKTGREIMSFLKETSLEKGANLIIVTHSREVGEMADRIINIRDGMIITEERLR